MLVFSRHKCKLAVMTMIFSLPSSPGHPAGGCGGPGGEAVRAGSCDELHNVPQTGLQRGDPPTLTLPPIHGGAQLAWSGGCPVRLDRNNKR